MTTCIACEGFPVKPNSPCGLCGATEQPEKHEKYLPATTHSAAECSAAFEWLRAEATRDGASPHAGVALDEWHALTAWQTRERNTPTAKELLMRYPPTVGEVIEAEARKTQHQKERN